MNFFYDLIAGNSRITPVGVAVSAACAWYIARTAFAPYAAPVFIGLLLATLFLGVLEKER